MSKQQRRAGEVQIDDAELTKIAKATGAPKAAVATALKRARKSGHRTVAVAWDAPVRKPTSEQRGQIRKQQELRHRQLIADRQELQMLLQRLIARYGREQVIKLVRAMTAPPPRPRGRRSPFAASTAKSLIEEVERRRQAGSRRPVRDLYEAIFIEERQSDEHYNNWRKEFYEKIKRGRKSLARD